MGDEPDSPGKRPPPTRKRSRSPSDAGDPPRPSPSMRPTMKVKQCTKNAKPKHENEVFEGRRFSVTVTPPPSAPPGTRYDLRPDRRVRAVARHGNKFTLKVLKEDNNEPRSEEEGGEEGGRSTKRKPYRKILPIDLVVLVGGDEVATKRLHVLNGRSLYDNKRKPTKPSDLVSKLPGVGSAKGGKLEKAGIRTVADLAGADPADLLAKLREQKGRGGRAAFSKESLHELVESAKECCEHSGVDDRQHPEPDHQHHEPDHQHHGPNHQHNELLLDPWWSLGNQEPNNLDDDDDNDNEALKALAQYSRPNPSEPSSLNDGEAHVNNNGEAHVNNDGKAHVNNDGEAHVNSDGEAHVNNNGEAHVNSDGEAHVNSDGEAHVNSDGEAHVNIDGEAHVNSDGEARDGDDESSDDDMELCSLSELSDAFDAHDPNIAPRNHDHSDRDAHLEKSHQRGGPQLGVRDSPMSVLPDDQGAT